MSRLSRPCDNLRCALDSGKRAQERGGVTILTVLGLLVLATVVAFSLSKGVLRELTNTGTVWQSAKSAEAAEAGLDWFILWSNKSNWDTGTATGNKRSDLVSALQQLNREGSWQTNTYLLDTSISDSTQRWDRAARLVSTETETNDMVLANSGTGYSQATAVGQSFDIAFRYLGAPITGTISSGIGNPAGQGSPRTGRNVNLYQVISTGKASVNTSGSNYMRYLSTREMYITVAP